MRPRFLVKRLLAHGLMALALVGLAGACQPSEPWTSDNPAFALDAFLSALRAGDQDTVEAFLSDQTLAFLEATRQDLQDTLGDQATVDLQRPADLLYRVWTPSAIEIDHLETVSRDGQGAVVAIHSVFGDVQQVTMRRVQGRWTVDLIPDDPAPATTPTESP